MTLRNRTVLASLLVGLLLALGQQASAAERLRLIIETDAGGDPDDEQSLVRFLLYVNEWDVEGIIANRPHARDGENKNPERTGPGIVRRLLRAYGECYPNLSQHDPRYPTLNHLWQRTVPGDNDTQEAVNLIIAAVDRDDPRPLWYSDWGTDHGAATNNLRRALDKVLHDRGRAGYAMFKSRLRLSSADAFGDHTSKIDPPFPLWVDTFRPERDGKRWYHRFSALTAKAGGFDLARDCLTGHGPLGALYPTNTTHWQKEGDTMTFLYLVPTGMNDPEQPTWGSWAGRYGSNTNFPNARYFWANPLDAWNGATNRDNILARWAEAIQNDFKARLDWCVKDFAQANHPPVPRVRGETARTVKARGRVELDASESSDPDGIGLHFHWFHYPEPGSYRGGRIEVQNSTSAKAFFVAPKVSSAQTAHLILAVTDDGSPPLTRYRRVVVTFTPAGRQTN
jgi:hypothetical protein